MNVTKGVRGEKEKERERDLLRHRERRKKTRERMNECVVFLSDFP